MTNDDILRMAIECQLVTTGNREGIYSETLMRFAKLVAAHEREACAKICDDGYFAFIAADIIRERETT